MSPVVAKRLAIARAKLTPGDIEDFSIEAVCTTELISCMSPVKEIDLSNNAVCFFESFFDLRKNPEYPSKNPRFVLLETTGLT
jgi:hypothetical protein